MSPAVWEARRLQFSNHALRRLRERHFTVDDVQYCLKHVEIQHPDDKGNPCYVAHLPDGRGIEVVLDERQQPPKVITVID